MEPLKDHKNHPNQHQSSHKLCDKKGIPFAVFKESQWKLRQKHQNLSIKRKRM